MLDVITPGSEKSDYGVFRNFTQTYLAGARIVKITRRRFRGVSRAAATSKMEHFVTIVNG